MSGGLLPQHRADFERSGLSAATIEASGAYSVTQLEAKQLIGFDPGSGGWVLPYPHREGLPDEFDFKPDIPFVGSDGKSRKYLRRINSINRIYVPPMLPMERLQSKRETLCIVEGAKKALKAAEEGFACIALSGVWNWKFRDSMNDSRTIEDLLDIWLKGRDVLICFDSDVTTKQGVATAEFQLAKKLRELGAEKVEGIRFPAGPNGEKVGGDDYLMSHTKDDFWQLPRDPLTSVQDDKGRSENLTDLGNARRFVTQHRNEIRYVPSWGWLCWNGKVWEHDNTGEIQRKAKATVMGIYAEVMRAEDPDVRKAISKHATKSESEASIDHMIELGKTEKEIVALPADFDTDPFLLNCLNGTIDLRTGKLNPHNKTNMITKIAAVTYDPVTSCPLFEKFLMQIMDKNISLIRFLQRIIGYSLTGDTSEQCLFILHGSGANGKSTLLTVIQHLLGDYAKQSPSDTFLAKQNQNIPNDVAMLAGARLVSVMETDMGRRLAESLIKSITGNDVIVARFLHKEFFEFRPSFKLWLSSNYKPGIRGTDYAIWRRIKLIPFNVTIPPDAQDKKLDHKLIAELPGILHWGIQGCLDWQKYGISIPDEVGVATANYRDEMADNVCHFINDACTKDIDGRVQAKLLFEKYLCWCTDNGDEGVSQKIFKLRLHNMGFQQRRTGQNGCYEWHGVRFTEETDKTEPKNPFFYSNSSHEKNIENDFSHFSDFSNLREGEL